SKISSNFKIPPSTVYNTINCYKKTGSSHPNKHSERPNVLSNRGKRSLQRIVYKDRFSSLGEITNKLNNDFSTNYHSNTIRKYLYKMKLINCISRKKPLLTKKHRID
ncbi:16811_t:CDS:1, partial [Funneliformis geosporum]